jgi:xylitol oxidase
MGNMDQELKNWAGNYQYKAANLYSPGSIQELQTLVADSKKAKALGTRHSFNSIADTPSDLIRTTKLNKIVSLDRERSQVTIQGGIAYGELAAFLDREGFALRNLASLPHISVAGACATATHGSGVHNQSLTAAVSAMDVVVADGSIATFSRELNPHEFDGAAVSLGALGIVAQMTLDLVPTFQVAQAVYEDLPMSVIDDNLEAILSGGYSVSLFTKWNSDFFHQVWVKKLTSDFEPTFFGAVLADSPLHMIREMPAENCTIQLGQPGPWHLRLPHFKMEFTPSGGEELQSEYFVSRKDGVAALRAVYTLRDEIAPLLYVTEVRTVAADNFWMSPAYQRDSMAIHFTWRPYSEEVAALLPKIEQALQPFHPRPHWGKIFAMSSDQLEGAYPKFPDFRTLITTYDPTAKFRNPFLDEKLF